jgi:hypothetical protein
MFFQLLLEFFDDLFPVLSHTLGLFGIVAKNVAPPSLPFADNHL